MPSMAEDTAEETGDLRCQMRRTRMRTSQKQGVQQGGAVSSGVDNLADPDNLELQHNINLALRAHNSDVPEIRTMW